MRYLLIIAFLTAGLFKKDTLGLKADLIKDKKRLAEEHGIHINEKGLNAFEKYAALDLSRFSAVKKVVDNNNVIKWTSKSNPKFFLFKIETVLAGDTVFSAKRFDPLTKRASAQEDIIKLNPRDYVYYTYIIVPEKGKQLVYLREKNEGLVQYRVNSQEYHTIRESIALGQNYPDLDKIIKSALALK